MCVMEPAGTWAAVPAAHSGGQTNVVVQLLPAEPDSFKLAGADDERSWALCDLLRGALAEVGTAWPSGGIVVSTTSGVDGGPAWAPSYDLAAAVALMTTARALPHGPSIVCAGGLTPDGTLTAPEPGTDLAADQMAVAGRATRSDDFPGRRIVAVNTLGDLSACLRGARRWPHVDADPYEAFVRPLEPFALVTVRPDATATDARFDGHHVPQVLDATREVATIRARTPSAVRDWLTGRGAALAAEAIDRLGPTARFAHIARGDWDLRFDTDAPHVGVGTLTVRGDATFRGPGEQAPVKLAVQVRLTDAYDYDMDSVDPDCFAFAVTHIDGAGANTTVGHSLINLTEPVTATLARLGAIDPAAEPVERMLRRWADRVDGDMFAGANVGGDDWSVYLTGADGSQLHCVLVGHANMERVVQGHVARHVSDPDVAYYESLIYGDQFDLPQGSDRWLRADYVTLAPAVDSGMSL